MNLDLVASELSMVIFENDNISQNKLGEKLREYIENHFKLLPCHIDYVIDKAYEIYEKI